ncbi:OLC1v1006107C1 [Oldenlandia corymbosa var. corymbosa]|uniref:OLC1v1006107C1 n=1 Tax=Oldenlandia corymbosa var. corymbosa TaxID=529605 RepID=A0AAV1DGP2_OLDCO|nr:OLC1v1006107C1 [Oldenlandia corymbosa var. corymbosa]
MASHEREGLLPVQLFQDGDVSSEDFNTISHQQQQSLGFKGLRKYESISISCGSSYSSWSDLSSPFGSELETTSTSETTESEDEEFISELTRQMAESMLQDDDDEEEEVELKRVQFQAQDRDDCNTVDSVSTCFPDNNSEASESSVNWSDCKSSSVCYYSCPEFPTPPESSVNAEDSLSDEQLRPVEVYELKNQPQLNNNNQDSGVVGGYGNKRVDKSATESTHQPLHQQKEQQNRVGGGGGKAWKQQGKKNNNILPPVLPTQPNGSGMRAVFLGGSDKNGYTSTTGTGVFLPTAAAYTKPEPKRKSGCSTVLIPARVLQTLQQHFNTVGTTSPSNAPSGGSPANHPWRNDVLARINGLLSQKREHAEFQTRLPPRPAYSAPETTSYHPEVLQLPQEWTY